MTKPATVVASLSGMFSIHRAISYRLMDWNIPDDEATTVAGFVIHETRSIPEPGQSFTFRGFRFQVLRKTRNRITALRVAAAYSQTHGKGQLN